MAIKTIPLSRLEANPRQTLSECADSGEAVVVELPDQRLIAIHPLEPSDDDELTDQLLASNAAFQALVAVEGEPAEAVWEGEQRLELLHIVG